MNYFDKHRNAGKFILSDYISFKESFIKNKKDRAECIELLEKYNSRIQVLESKVDLEGDDKIDLDSFRRIVVLLKESIKVHDFVIEQCREFFIVWVEKIDIERQLEEFP
jgi:hypothetical protein